MFWLGAFCKLSAESIQPEFENLSIGAAKQFAFRCSNCHYDKIVELRADADATIHFARPPVVCVTCGSINSFKTINVEDAVIQKPKQLIQSDNNLSFLDRINLRDRASNKKATITDPSNHKKKPFVRSSTGVEALDYVTGGGLAHGFVLMLAGPPGCGKSTICTQAISSISDKGMHYGKGGAYGSSEEDDDSIIETAERVAKANFKIVRSKNILESIEGLDSTDANTWVMDSLMEYINPELQGEPGSPSQVNSCISIIYDRAKAEGKYKGLPKRTILIIAHGTKGGDMAGPLKALHGVDGAVLFEHVDPIGDEIEKRLPFEPVVNQTKPTGYVSIRVFRKMRKTANNRIAYMQMQPEFLQGGEKNPIGGRLDLIDGPEWSNY